ncbi:MAG: DUF669 domain-containing protein [Actinomycetota bacterium]
MAAPLEVDFTDADEINFEPLPKGWYEVAVYEAKLEYSQAGNPMIVFELNVLNGPYPGKKLWLRNAIDGKDKNYYLKRTLTAIGYHVTGKAKINLDDLCGRYARVLVEHELYKEKTREKVVDIVPLEDGGYGDDVVISGDLVARDSVSF